MSVPGTAWVALILALTGALGGWLTDYVSEPWVPLAVLALSLVAKAAEIYFSNKKEIVAGATVMESGKVIYKERSTVSRLLFG